MPCENCGKMNSDVPGKAPFEYFQELDRENLSSVKWTCSCTEQQLRATEDATFYGKKVDWYDAQAVRLCNARTPGGIADYEAACEDAEMYRHKFDEAWAIAKGRISPSQD